jgi:hypothetical protein
MRQAYPLDAFYRLITSNYTPVELDALQRWADRLEALRLEQDREGWSRKV